MSWCGRPATGRVYRRDTEFEKGLSPAQREICKPDADDPVRGCRIVPVRVRPNGKSQLRTPRFGKGPMVRLRSLFAGRWWPVVGCSVALALLRALGETVRAQSPATVDFGRDVLPILRQNCVGCHGPSQQMNGLRLDRRSSVFKAGFRRVVPGSSENSFLYHRLIGSEYGVQMPPTGPLRPEQVSVIKTWIEQGADWPDALANEADLPPANPKAVAMVDALRTGYRRSFMKFGDQRNRTVLTIASASNPR